MTAEDLLKEARSLGADFQVLESGGIKVQAGSPLPAALMQELRSQKPAVMAPLTETTPSLLAWAAQAAEEKLKLAAPVHFMETPFRPCTAAEVGRYCRDLLRFLFMSRSNRETDGWGRFTP